MKTMISHTMTFSVGSTVDLEKHINVLADFLIDLEGPHSPVLDSSVGVDLGDGIVEVAVTIASDDYARGVATAEDYIRAAVRHAEEKDQDWESSVVAQESSVVGPVEYAQ